MLRFPDVQLALITDLELLVGAGHTGIETPTDLAGTVPFVRARRVGGSSDMLNDYSTVDVDVFDTTYRAAELLAEQIRQRWVGDPPIAAIDRIGCDVGPRELPWGDGIIRRMGATYQAVARRHNSA